MDRRRFISGAAAAALVPFGTSNGAAKHEEEIGLLCLPHEIPAHLRPGANDGASRSVFVLTPTYRPALAGRRFGHMYMTKGARDWFLTQPPRAAKSYFNWWHKYLSRRFDQLHVI